MFKSLEELVTALEAIEPAKTIAPDVKSFFTVKQEEATKAIETEKQKGIAAKTKVNQEAEGLRKYKIAFEKNFGFNPEQDDLETFAQDLSEVIKQVKDGGAGDGVKTSQEFKELSRQMTKMQKDFKKVNDDLESERKKSNELKAKTNQSLIRNRLLDAFKDEKGEPKIYAPDMVADNLISSGKVKLDEDEKTILFVNGSDTVEFEDGVKGFLESRKDLIRNKQNGGSGSGGNNNSGGAGNTETLEQRKKRIQNLANPAGF